MTMSRDWPVMSTIRVVEARGSFSPLAFKKAWMLPRDVLLINYTLEASKYDLFFWIGFMMSMVRGARIFLSWAWPRWVIFGDLNAGTDCKFSRSSDCRRLPITTRDTLLSAIFVSRSDTWLFHVFREIYFLVLFSLLKFIVGLATVKFRFLTEL